jgi:hypothetical protein
MPNDTASSLMASAHSVQGIAVMQVSCIAVVGVHHALRSTAHSARAAGVLHARFELTAQLQAMLKGFKPQKHAAPANVTLIQL